MTSHGETDPTRRVIALFGPPGAGKGTQAELSVARYGLVHLATGNLLRNEIARGTELGRNAESIIKSGNLVPDDVVEVMMRDKIAEGLAERGRVLLDGYPRTLSQADHLEEFLESQLGHGLDLLIFMDVADEVIMQRLLGRLICRNCGAIYHQQKHPPRQGGVCDRCGGPVVRRSDDTRDSVRERLDVYRRQTMPILERFAGQERFALIDADGEPDEVDQRVDSRLAPLMTDGS